MPVSRMQQRRDTSSNWALYNPVLLDGELGVDTTVDRIKVGDGTTAWADLSFADRLEQINLLLAAAQTAAAAAQAYRDQAEAITGLTGEDGAVAALLRDLESDTATALATSIGQAALGPGDGLLDFRNLPDGPVALKAARGTFVGIHGGSDLDDFSIEDGRLVAGAGAPNNYVEVEAAEKIQYLAARFDILNATPSSSQGVTFHIVAPGGWIATGSSVVHDQLFASIGGTAKTCGNFTCGPYNAPGAGPTINSADNHTLAPAGREGILVEITHDLRTGLIRNYYDGVLLVERQDADNPAHSGTSGMFQFNNGNANVRLAYLHVSPDIPGHLREDTADRVTANGYTANTTLDNTWKKIHEFWVTGPSSGVIEVSYFPAIDVTGGKVQAGVGPASGFTPGSYEQVLIRESGGDEAWARVPFVKTYYVTPGVAVQLAIYMTTDGTATLRDIYGADPGSEGPRWRPVIEQPATAAS